MASYDQTHIGGADYTDYYGFDYFGTVYFFLKDEVGSSMLVQMPDGSTYSLNYLSLVYGPDRYPDWFCGLFDEYVSINFTSASPGGSGSFSGYVFTSEAFVPVANSIIDSMRLILPIALTVLGVMLAVRSSRNLIYKFFN